MSILEALKNNHNNLTDDFLELRKHIMNPDKNVITNTFNQGLFMGRVSKNIQSLSDIIDSIEELESDESEQDMNVPNDEGDGPFDTSEEQRVRIPQEIQVGKDCYKNIDLNNLDKFTVDQLFDSYKYQQRNKLQLNKNGMSEYYKLFLDSKEITSPPIMNIIDAVHNHALNSISINEPKINQLLAMYNLSGLRHDIKLDNSQTELDTADKDDSYSDIDELIDDIHDELEGKQLSPEYSEYLLKMRQYENEKRAFHGVANPNPPIANIRTKLDAMHYVLHNEVSIDYAIYSYGHCVTNAKI